MAVRELYRVWATRLSIATTIIVVLLSWLNELSILDLMIRAGISFGAMYLLMAGILNIFERTAPQEPRYQLSPASSCGGNIDFSVGDEKPLNSQKEDEGFSRQIDPNLSSGLPDSEREAEIVRRMGWD